MSSLYRKDREYLISANNDMSLSAAMGIYENTDIHPLLDENSDPNKKEPLLFGGKLSLFNATSSILSAKPFREKMSMPLYDSAEYRNRIRQFQDCSIKNLVKLSEEGKLGRATYDYTDFMYCKHLGKVPNNYLITLRRFEVPVGDHINYDQFEIKDEVKAVQKSPVSIGRMVTWLGVSGNDISNIMKYNYHQDWNQKSSQWQNNSKTKAGNNKGPLASVFNAMTSDYQASVIQGINASAIPFDPLNADSNFYGESELAAWNDRNRPYGKANIITKTTILGTADENPNGITFEQDIQLVFEYEMKSYYGINQKAAFMDLLANILRTTFTEADFWRGGFRSIGPQASNLYTNLPLFKDAAAGKICSWSDFIESSANSLNSVASLFADSSGKLSISSILGKLGEAASASIIGNMLNKLGRPQKQVYQSLLNPQPTGLWHLTVGNPNNPVLSIGNLYISHCEIEHNGLFGIDDFPTGLKVTVTLKHGKPRSIREIEMMYLNGNTRAYIPMNKRYNDVLSKSKKIGGASKQNSKKMNFFEDQISYIDEQTKDSKYTIQADTVGTEFKKFLRNAGMPLEDDTIAYSIGGPESKSTSGAYKSTSSNESSTKAAAKKANNKAIDKLKF